MSNAKKCDRCGKLYENYKGVKITEGGNSYNTVIFTGNNYGNRDFDLCPDCMSKLIEFIKEGKTER